MHRITRTPKARRQSRATSPAGARWQLQVAKAKFSQVIKLAQEKPQIITLRGEEVAVIESIQAYRKRSAGKAGPNLFEILLQCPPGPPLVIDRDPDDTVGDMPSVFE